MIDLDLVKLLRVAADEYEAVIKRNRELDRDINELKRKYNEDITKLRSNPSPKIHTARVVVSPEKLKEMSKTLEEEKKKVTFPPDMVVAAMGGISKRASGALVRCGVIRVRDFSRLSLARLRNLKGCGTTTSLEIQDLAKVCGYTLK
jgi:tetrahydromethanopterin S-methyltransferase subunit G